MAEDREKAIEKVRDDADAVRPARDSEMEEPRESGRESDTAKDVNMVRGDDEPQTVRPSA